MTMPDNQDISFSDPNVNLSEYSPFFQPTNVMPPEEPPNGEPPPEPELTVAEPDFITAPDGRTIPVDQFNKLYEFDQFITSNPVAWQTIQTALREPPILNQPAYPPSPAPPAADLTQPPPPVPAQYPPGYEDDPAYKALWDRTAALEARLEAQDTYQVEERKRNAQAALATATTHFQSRYSLTDEQMQQLQWQLVQNGMGRASLEANPIDPIGAFERAYEYSFFTTPGLRDEFLSTQSVQHSNTEQKDRSRKAKLSAVSGTGGTTPPKEPPKPRTRQERVEAMANEIARARAGA